MEPSLVLARRPAHSGGFTLIELLIAMVVIVILAAVALPSYQNSVRKSRRSDAINALNAVQQAQERSRSSFSTYCSEIASGPTAGSCGLGLGSVSSQARYYQLAIPETPTGSTYIATAAASSTGAQAADTPCLTMAVRMDRGTLTYGSSSTSTVDWTDPGRCWAK